MSQATDGALVASVRMLMAMYVLDPKTIGWFADYVIRRHLNGD